MRVQDIIINKPYLAWYIDSLENMSDESVLEHVLNYGDFDDVKKYIEIKGIKQTSKIFDNSIKKERSNYRPEIVHYFTLYFKKYAR